jgi:predicted nucleotide-binding protein
VKKFGFSATELSKKLGLSQQSVFISVKRGAMMAKAEQLELIVDKKVIILWTPNPLGRNPI